MSALLGLGIASGVGSIASGILGGNAAKKNAKKLQQAQDAANAANEARYQQLLAGADEMRLDSMGALNSQYAQLFNMNDQYNLDAPLQRNEQQTQAEVGGIGQNLIGRGLYNSTIATGAETGARREGALRGNEIRNRYTDQTMNLRSRYSDLLQGNIRDYYGARQGVIERRTDAQPNPALYQTQGSALGSAINGIGQLGTQLYGQYQNQQYNDRYLDLLKQMGRG